jgi:hypothetical protein
MTDTQVRTAKFQYSEELGKWVMVMSYWFEGNHYGIMV